MANGKSYGGMSALDALNRLNVVAASALGAFFMVSLVMLGLASPIVDVLEAHRFLPLAMSYLLMIVAFLSSGSRDIAMYHRVEVVWVALTSVLMLFFAWPAFVDAFMAFAPLSQFVMLIVMGIATAILAR